jgi:hypothetical protein
MREVAPMPGQVAFFQIEVRNASKLADQLGIEQG